jgi:ADP-dependent phosphofructokinase/glucokinase
VEGFLTLAAEIHRWLVVGLDNVKLADIVKAVIKDLASEIVGKDSVTQALGEVVKKLTSGFDTLQVTVKIGRDGKVDVWIFVETM